VRKTNLSCSRYGTDVDSWWAVSPDHWQIVYLYSGLVRQAKTNFFLPWCRCTCGVGVGSHGFHSEWAFALGSSVLSVNCDGVLFFSF